MKRIILIIACVLTAIVLLGCIPQKPESPGGFLENMQLLTGKNNVEPPQVQPFKDLTVYGIKTDELKKDIVVKNYQVIFNSLYDLETCLANEKLRAWYKEKYDKYWPKFYYTSKFCSEHFDDCVAVLTYKIDFSVSIGYANGQKEGVLLDMVMGYPEENAVQEVTIGLDGIDYKTANYNGREIYWYTSDNKTFGVRATTYIWQKDGFIEKIIFAGEHSESNFEFCEMSKHNALENEGTKDE